MKQPIALSIRSADLKINRNFFFHSIEHQLAESPYLPRKPLNLFSTIGRRRRGSSCCLLPLGTRLRGTCSSFPWLRTADRHKQARISPILLLLRSRFKLLRPADLSSPTPSRVIIMVQFKNRYLVIEVLINGHKDSSGNDPIIITEYNLLKAIKDSIMLNFGECGLALSLGSLQVKYANPSTKLCIIRTSRDDYQMIWSAMTMVKSIGKCPIALNLLVLSGTLKACKSAALKCEEAKFEQYKLEAAGNHLSPEKLSQIRGYIERINTLEN